MQNGDKKKNWNDENCILQDPFWENSIIKVDTKITFRKRKLKTCVWSMSIRLYLADTWTYDKNEEKLMKNHLKCDGTYVCKRLTG